uniref:Uncharacterized protein n=1 Tax=Desulfovibrio sp. U5L TaxID=596152 RepID=I2Q1E3_9BACT
MSEQGQSEISAADAAFDALFGDGEAGGAADESAGTPGGGAPEGAGSEAAGGATGAAGEGQVSDQAGAAEGSEGAAGAEAGDGTGGDPAELEQLRNHAKTQEGRLARAEEERQRAQEELAALKAGKSAGGEGASDPNAPQAVEIPKGLEADAAEFDELFPEMKALLRRPGPVGDRLRRVLKESGADIAGVAAENVVLREKLEEGLQTVDARAAARTQQEHIDQIVGKHPELRSLYSTDPAEKEKGRAYKAGVQAWIETLPFKDATEKMQIFENGSAADVDALLTEYKQKTNDKSQKTELDADARRRAADATGVDNRRGSRPRRERTDAEKADEAFDKRFGG